MTTFSLDSDNLFIEGYDGGRLITVWKVENDKLDKPMLLNKDWQKVATLTPNNGDKIELFNRTIEGSKLNQLVEELEARLWVVNREGCVYMFVRLNNDSESYRINDFFGWSKYEVHRPSRHTVWNKVEIRSKEVIVDLVTKDKLLAEYKQKLEKEENKLSSCEKELKEKEKELSSYKKKLDDCQKELKVVTGELIGERKKGSTFLAALKGLITFLDKNPKKEFDHYGALLKAVSDAKDHII